MVSALEIQQSQFMSALKEDAAIAIEQRIDHLERQARGERGQGELTKLVAGSLGLTILASGVTPLAVFTGTIGLALYGLNVGVEAVSRRKLDNLVPGVRLNIFEMLGISAGGDDDPLADMSAYIDDLCDYLAPRDATEYELLMLKGDELAGLLTALPTDRRYWAYRYALRQSALHGILPTLEQTAKATQSEVKLQKSTLKKVGATTKLQALPVESSVSSGVGDEDSDPWEAASGPAALNRIAAQTDSDAIADIALTSSALEALTASPYISRAFFGAQRSGKTYLASQASKQLHPTGVKTFHINLASYGLEDSGYWSHVPADRSVCCDISAMSAGQAGIEIQKAMKLIEEFYRTPKSILIVDEFVYLGEASNSHSALLKPLIEQIAGKISTLSSSGMKRQLAVWTIGPKCVADELTSPAKAMKGLELCYVTIAPGHTVEWCGMPITFSGELFQQVKRNYPIDMPAMSSAIAGCDRIAYVNREWKPVGV